MKSVLHYPVIEEDNGSIDQRYGRFKRHTILHHRNDKYFSNHYELYCHGYRWLITKNFGECLLKFALLCKNKSLELVQNTLYK